MKTISPADGVLIDLRVSPEFKILFSRAAEIAGVSLAAFRAGSGGLAPLEGQGRSIDVGVSLKF